jgi:hypothetical protein
MSLFKRQDQIMEKIDKLKNADFRLKQWQVLLSHIKAIYQLHNKADMYIVLFS